MCLETGDKNVRILFAQCDCILVFLITRSFPSQYDGVFLIAPFRRLLTHVLWKDLVDKLPRVIEATHKSERIAKMSTCFEGTRASVLEEIKTWINNNDGKCIFWLNGMAGIGKTTIARTIVDEMKENKGILLASFFFSKDDRHARDYRRVFTTLAYQLAFQRSQIKIALAQMIKTIGDCSDHPVVKQRDEFIVEPLKTLNGSRHTVLFIIDALDECESNDDTSNILRLFLELESRVQCKLRILITSRPEYHIQNLFNKTENHERVVLHNIDAKVVREDIERYVRHRLQSIFGEQHLLDESDITRLVEKSGNLFIYAETVLRFIEGGNVNDPQEQLAIILDTQTDPDVKPYDAVDKLYLQVFEKALSQDVAFRKRVEKRIDRITGVIVMLRQPLPVTALARFVGETPSATQSTLASLQSVILVPSSPNEAPRIFHPSFIDFITNKDRCTDKRFLVDVPARETILAKRCLELMVASLRQNMATIEDETTRNVEVVDLEGRVKKAIPDELRYACLHWAAHMTAAEHADGMSLLDQFTRGRLLNWMEAMSLLGEVPRAILMMRDAHAWAVSAH